MVCSQNSVYYFVLLFTEETGDQLPKTLQYLVIFWEKLSDSTRTIVRENLLQGGPAEAIQRRRQDKLQADKNAAENSSSKKKKEMKGHPQCKIS